MYKVYFTDKVIIFGPKADGYNENDTIIVWDGVRFPDKNELLSALQAGRRTVVVSDEPKKALETFLGLFRSIEAGGGLVSNPAGDLLMIFRHNRWDLPKGKLEPGERIEDCAVREVEEECGISGPQRERFLTHTYHLYKLDGDWVVKRTWWYRMAYAGREPLVPQTEEFITAIEWIAPGKLDTYIRSSYPTVRDVFAAAGFTV